MINYLAYRVFGFFNKEEDERAVSKTISFLVLLEGSLVVPLFMLIDRLENQGYHLFGEDNSLKYFVGIPLFELLILAHSTFIKRRFQGMQFNAIKHKYHKEQYRLPVGVIFASPAFFIFIFPVAFNTTVSLRFIESVILGSLWI